jgi:acetyl-CoA carboxylase / biotin carboxylase 1
VVVDPSINPHCMEMYADEEARAGVLEPEGIINLRYRRDKQLETMARLDPTYADLITKLKDTSLSQEEISDLKVKLTARQQLLRPVYEQISLQFADLHDRAGRMKAKHVIRDSLRWREARRFFYWRLRRRLNEEYIMKRMSLASKTSVASRASSRARHLETLAAWTGITEFDRADKEAAMWYEENRKTIHEKVELLKTEGAAFDVASLLRGSWSNGKGGLKGVHQVLSMLPAAEREEALKYLSSS